MTAFGGAGEERRLTWTGACCVPGLVGTVLSLF